MSLSKRSDGVGRATGLAPCYTRKQISLGGGSSCYISDNRDFSSLLKDQILHFAKPMHSMLAQ
jgi:hypothetical protein